MNVTLAHTYRERDDVNGYWVQPKLDGCRAVYNGGLISRTGKSFNAPDWWLEEVRSLWEELGFCPVDGELVLDTQLEGEENGFNELVSIVRKKSPVDDEWARVRFAIFDFIAPTVTYQRRYETLERLNVLYDRTQLVPVIGVVDDDLRPDDWLRVASDNGWEGVMLRNPNAPYEHRRTRNLLKIKPMADEEFVVTGMQAGTGKHAGRMGALLCQREGKEFKVGTGFTDADRELRDWVGKTITVEYFELTPRGVPRHPRFKGIRDYE
jgi:DNA ligase-1